MSETNPVSPLLDGFTVGSPMSSHDGIECCPAIKENSDKRYIVKYISIPPSRTQLDALLLTGAYKDPAEAAEYFREQAEDIGKEAEALKKLSRLEGFLPYEDWQILPIQKDRIGYLVCLLSEYRLSFEKYMRRNPVTHLEAVNFGIDMCSALLACRRAGMLYINLKPSNVFVSSRKDYQIGDLGFASLSTLKYASMPGKYRSAYTAPELLDDLNPLNTTADTYALGMILYQIFNNGQLPENREKLQAPSGGNPEIQKIILKACDPDPEKRWKDPAQMGQALVAYMQRNTINNTMIMEPIGEILPDPAPTEEAPAEGNTSAGNVSEETVQEPEAPLPEDTAEVSGEAPEGDPVSLTPTDETEEAASEIAEPIREEAEPEDIPADSEELQESAKDSTPMDSEAAPDAPVEENDFPSDVDLFDLDAELSEVDQLLSDTAPAKKETPKPAPVRKQENIKPVVMTSTKVKPMRKKHGLVKFLVTLLLLLLFLTLAAGGYVYYENYYLQTVDSISIEGNQSSMVVTIHSDIEDSLLTVSCSDPYGNVIHQGVQGGQAAFTELKPGSLYKVLVEVNGFHKLMGQVSDIFTTESITNIASMTAVTGAEDGSVLINFAVDGHEPDEWKIFYIAEGEPELAHTFTGHSATITNLVIGKEYTLRLETGDQSPLQGQNSVSFTSASLVMAQNLVIASIEDSVMQVEWEAPEDTEVESWKVRCYGEGYDETRDVTETHATFVEISSEVGYTVEVTAKGMTQPARATVSANPITLSSFTVDDSVTDRLNISWDFSGALPNDGWLLLYTVDDGTLPVVEKCDIPFSVISNRIPGSTYHFSIQTADGGTVFNSSCTYTAPDAEVFSKHGITGYRLTAKLLVTPGAGKWNYAAVNSSDYTSVFAPGENISLVLQAGTNFYLDDVDVSIQYVVRDENGNALPELAAHQTANWAHIWAAQDYHYAELNATTAPSTPGKYTLEVYLDGGLACTNDFTVS